MCIELLPESQWKGPSKVLPGTAAAAGDDSPSSDDGAAATTDEAPVAEIFQVGQDSTTCSQ